jgi:hypothetical protein
LQEHPEGTDAGELCRKIFPQEGYTAEDFRLRLSYLQKLLDQFLALEHWQNTPAAPEKNLVQAYRQRGLERPFQDALKQARQVLERQPRRNQAYVASGGALLWEEAHFHSMHGTEIEPHLLALSENADQQWLLHKLHYCCLHTSYRTRFNSENALSLRREMEMVLQQTHYTHLPAIGTWYACLNMLEHPENADFFTRFKGAILENGACFDDEELRSLHFFALNFCIRRVNVGESSYFHDIMDIYKDGLERRYLLQNDILPHITYHNIVAAGLQTQDYEFVGQFISEYRSHLERRYRDSAYSFNLARLKMARKDYDEALRLLQHANYHDPLLNMAAKTMAIKIYYALDEYEVLSAHLDAFIKYIRRKAGLGYHRNHYLQMARYTQKLMALNWNNKAEVQALREKILREPQLTEREWLLEQF